MHCNRFLDNQKENDFNKLFINIVYSFDKSMFVIVWSVDFPDVTPQKKGKLKQTVEYKSVVNFL